MPNVDPRPTAKPNRLLHVHDDMYFGDSRESVGLQVVDLCSFFMLRKLRGIDDPTFYMFMKDTAICAKPQPEWDLYKHVANCHD
jgi:hypothetical protein